MNRSSGGIGWCIALAVAVLLLLAVLELGKHTWLGWILGILAVVGFVFLRDRVLAGQNIGIRLLGWVGSGPDFRVSCLNLNLG